LTDAPEGAAAVIEDEVLGVLCFEMKLKPPELPPGKLFSLWDI
jgi:hypothetical protein